MTSASTTWTSPASWTRCSAPRTTSDPPRGLVEADAIVRLAAERAQEGDDGPALELALLLTDQRDEVPGLLRAAADAEPTAAGAASEQKWLYLLLRALYQAQDRLTEPLTAVEDVYELFDHPAELAGLIYYLPVPEGEEPGEAGIYDRWRRYLDAAGQRLRRVSTRQPAERTKQVAKP